MPKLQLGRHEHLLRHAEFVVQPENAGVVAVLRGPDIRELTGPE
jgi:hypothetical protein